VADFNCAAFVCICAGCLTDEIFVFCFTAICVFRIVSVALPFESPVVLGFGLTAIFCADYVTIYAC
jgi:hypothetical protein